MIFFPDIELSDNSDMSKMSKNKTILLVDDDENVRLLCERGLRNEGYITSSVSSGAEALQFINKHPHVDLIILDIKMPSLDGIEVLKRIRAKKVKIPVILYSNYSIYKDNLLTWLANSYLVKSSDLTRLKEKVKELLSIKA